MIHFKYANKNVTYGSKGEVLGISNNNNGNSDENSNNDYFFEYQVNIIPQDLIGMDALLYLVFESQIEHIQEKSVEMLTKLFINLGPSLKNYLIDIRSQFLNICIEKLKIYHNDPQAQKKIQIPISLIKNFCHESENYGIGELISHSGLVRGDKILINIKNEIPTINQNIPKSFELKIQSNKTILELKKQIAKQIDLTWDQIKLKRSQYYVKKDITDFYNGKTLADLVIKQSETLTVFKQNCDGQGRAILRVPLVDPVTKKLLEKPKYIFTDWFLKFSENGFMNKEQCAQFIDSCRKDNCKANDVRVQNVFKEHDLDNDGLLSLEDFIKFYETKINKDTDGIEIVWTNLKAYKFREDLSNYSDIDEKQVDIESLPRHMLLHNQEFFDILFSILQTSQCKQTSLRIWDLLNHLPTNKKIIQHVQEFEGIKNQQNCNWNQIFDKNSKFKLVYALNIIEYMMEDQHNENNEDKKQQNVSSSNNNKQFEEEEEEIQQQKENKMEEEISEKKQDSTQQQLQQEKTEQELLQIQQQKKSEQWRSDFISFGGFDQLYQIFCTVQQQQNQKQQQQQQQIETEQQQQENGGKSKNIQNILDRKILSFVLRIMKNYLIAAFSPHIPDIYKITKYSILPQYNLEDIDDHLVLIQNKTQIQEEQQVTEEQQQEKDQCEQVKKQQPGNNNKKPVVKETNEFKILVQKLEEASLGNKIIETLNIKNLARELINMLIQFLQQILINKQNENKGSTKENDNKDAAYSTTSGVDKLTNLLFSSSLDKEEKTIIDYILTILLSLLLYSPECLEDFLHENQKQSIQLLLLGLFFSVHVQVRKIFQRTIYMLFKYADKKFSKWVLNMLIDNVPKNKDDDLRRECNQYYELLCKIIEQKEDNGNSNYEELLQILIQNIYDWNSTEKRNAIKKDNILCGFLSLCEKLFKIQPQLAKKHKDFSYYIFQYMLFTTDPMESEQKQKNNGQDYVKCKGGESRKICFKIFNHILRQNQDQISDFLENYFQPLQKTIPLQTDWNYYPSKNGKSFQGYIGLKNLSNICYMNAMIQQFYMIPAFRYGILDSNDNIEENTVQCESTRKEYQNKSLDDNLLHQLQNMFAFLELSDRQDYNPWKFCYSFKDSYQQPINCSIQQDAQEFLNQMFDKLDNSIKCTQQRNLLDGVFGGRTCSQLVCEGCGNIKENVEIFYNLSLTVQNMNSLDESFKHLIGGELISDYYCEKCDKKQDTTKRVLINNVPNVLIIHLQRIVFDLESLMNKKMNTRLEFGQELDLKPYTKQEVMKKEKQQKEGGEEEIEEEGNTNNQDEKNNNIEKDEEECFKYRLKGVVMHSGTAEYGHYYSYIKENCEDNTKWKEFNDSNIRDFNVKDLEKECFGGNAGNSNLSEDQEITAVGSGGKFGQHSKNAYMLVYEKIKQTPLAVTKQKEEQNEESEIRQNKAAINNNGDDEEQIIQDKKKESDIIKIPYNEIKQIVPEKLSSLVWQDNHAFMLEKQIYCEENFSFVRDLARNIELPKDFVRCDTYQQTVRDSLTPTLYQGNNLTSEQQKVYKLMLNFLTEYTFEIIAHANDNKIIRDLVYDIRDLIDLCGGIYIWEYFKTFILIKKQTIFEEIILKSPDVNVRNMYACLIVYLLNCVINHYNLTLSEENPNLEFIEIEQEIQELLKYILTLMNDQVQKAWVNDKNIQYQEMLKTLVLSGQIQLQWAFRNELIGRICDFFLGTKSKANVYGSKNNKMGNDYSKPSFVHLIQLLSNMVLSSNNIQGDYPETEVNCGIKNQEQKQMLKASTMLFDLSENDKLGLGNIEFYEKCLKNDILPDRVGLILAHQCHNNLTLSQEIAFILLPTYNTCGVDNMLTPLTLIGYYTMIYDQYTLKRYEYMYGFPQLKQATQVEEDSIFAIHNQINQISTTYCSSMDETQYSSILSTTYPDCRKPILTQIYEGQKQYENQTAYSLCFILELLSRNKTLLQYLLLSPPPSYCQETYLDWIKPFLIEYQDKLNKDLITTSKGEEMKSMIAQTINLYQNKVEPSIKQILLLLTGSEDILQSQKDTQINDENNQNINSNTNDNIDIFMLQQNLCLFENYIVGKITNKEVVDKQIINVHNDKNVYKIITDVTVYLQKNYYARDSETAQISSSIISADILDYDKKVDINNIHLDSNIWQFIAKKNNSDNNGPQTDVTQQKPAIVLESVPITDKESSAMEEESKQNDDTRHDNSLEEEAKINEGNLNNSNKNGNVIQLGDIESSKKMVNWDDIKECKFIKMIDIQNDTNLDLKLTISITKQDDFSNVVAPQCEISRIVKPNSITEPTKNVLIIHKRNSELDFGNIQINIVSEFIKSDADLQNNGNDANNYNQDQMIGPVGPYSLINQGPIALSNKQNDYISDDAGGVTCGACTFLNTYGSTQCDICGTPLSA